MGIPVLGICYGMQLMTVMLGGSVRSAQTKEYGKTDVELRDCALFDGIDRSTVCWMSHTDQADKLPEGFSAAATTATCPIAAIADEGRRLLRRAVPPGGAAHRAAARRCCATSSIRSAGWTATGPCRSSCRSTDRGPARKGGQGPRAAGALGRRGQLGSARRCSAARWASQLTCVFVDHRPDAQERGGARSQRHVRGQVRHEPASAWTRASTS